MTLVACGENEWASPEFGVRLIAIVDKAIATSKENLMNKCFGIGLSRTGTKSLATALNLLGIKTVWYPQDQQTYVEIAAAKYRLSVLQIYSGITDTPVAKIYPQLDREYPGSKFILTVRDVDAWLDSCSRHWSDSPVAIPLPSDAPLWQQYAAYINATVYGCLAFHPERFRYVYEQHVESVQAYFASRHEDLLVIG